MTNDSGGVIKLKSFLVLAALEVKKTLRIIGSVCRGSKAMRSETWARGARTTISLEFTDKSVGLRGITKL